MSLPRFALPDSVPLAENTVLPLDAGQIKHLLALRLVPGDSLEAHTPSGIWRAELADVSRHSASVRLVAPINENREAPIEIHACLPVTAQLGLWDDFLPGVVELGATLIQPVIYERSQYDKRKVDARLGRWRRIILTACEQSHRTRIPILHPPVLLESLQSWSAAQRWVAYELRTGEPNPNLALESLAFTHGPEGGIADAEIALLHKSGWKPVSLGKSILRAATCPAAILGAVQMELGRLNRCF